MDQESGPVPPNAPSLGMPPQNRSALPSQNQPGNKSTWFMQRPRILGADLTPFSFAKPASNRQGFTLRNLPKHPPINVAIGETTMSRESQNVAVQDSIESIAQSSTPLAPVEDSQIPPANIASNEVNGTSKEGSPMALSSGRDLVCFTGSKTTNVKLNPVLEIARQRPSKPLKPMDDPVFIVSPNTDPKPEVEKPSHSIVLPLISAKVNTSPQASVRSIHTQDRGMDTVTPINPAPQIQLPVKHDFPSPKRATRVRKVKPAKRQKSYETHQFTEDKLFELLIGKIKLREENEASAAYLQQQLEAQNIQLRDENRELEQQMQELHLRLEKRNEECKANISLLGGWKTKVRNIKQIVNELGHGYDELRDEADQLKETVSSLSKEKRNFTNIINDTKVRITQAEGAIEFQRNKNSNYEKTIALLEQGLQSSQDMEEATKSELFDQKRRTATLESYIQGHASAQSKQLIVIKENQDLLLGRIAAGITTITDGLNTANNNHALAVKDAFEECRSSVQVLAERSSEEQINTARFTQKAHEVVESIDCLSSQFTLNAEGVIKINNEVSKTMQKRFKEVESHIGPESLIIKQLGCFFDTCGSLKEKLEVMGPKLGALNTSVETITAAEGSLIHQLEDVGKKISEAQIPANNAIMDKELASKFAENTQLQIRLHDIASEIDSLNKLLGEKKANIEDLQGSLLEATDKQHSIEAQNKRLAIEKTDLQLEFESTERSIRQELDEKNFDSLNQMKFEHQIQIQSLQKEKDDIEKVAGELVAQLELIQQSLVEAKDLVSEQVQESELQLQERQHRIEELERCYTESIAQLAIQTEEIQKFQELDATSRVESTGLRDRLEQAQQKILNLEQKLNYSIQTEAISKQLVPQTGTSQYGESCDFAMLFMSDEICPSTVANDVPSPKLSPGSPKDAVRDDDGYVPPPESIGTSFLSPKKREFPDQYNKREAVMSKAQQNRKKGKKPATVQRTITVSTVRLRWFNKNKLWLLLVLPPLNGDLVQRVFFLQAVRKQLTGQRRELASGVAPEEKNTTRAFRWADF
ncbi:hypothetical protein N7478_000122 [Penicillium angulare]|uniref:uncharacterized protein n=1 Tax=Penicillium angulare TaxID=116970 RepID=UPI00253FE521|nr:uncharacterized protein N7478_000122 [Penicillium angulare]KAJ5290871.1 hypothetical protein N7478_000122 [Penicillium angulare]